MSDKDDTRVVRFIVALIAVFVILSLMALVGVAVYGLIHIGSAVSATVSGNVITPESSEAVSVTEKHTKTYNAGTSITRFGDSRVSLELYDKAPSVNIPFRAENMLPGDSYNNLYSVAVSCRSTVVLRFSADVREGGEKLSEVLKVKITENGSELYDGTINDMPDALETAVVPDGSGTGTADYTVTAYLDASVGNEYQNTGLIADFKWWVAEDEPLGPAPGTGDNSKVLIFAAVMLLSGAVLAAVTIIRRREAQHE